MPEEFAPEWEYWAPDPEIAALMCGAVGASGRHESAGALMVWEAAERERRHGVYSGLRFGRGNPDAMDPESFRERAERPRTGRDVLAPRHCRGCGRTFQPDRRSRAHCSHRCYTPPGRARVLPESRSCAVCGKDFRPLWSDHRLCGRLCRNRLAAAARPVKVTPDVLGMYGRLPTKDIADWFGVRVKAIHRAVRRYGGEVRLPGRPKAVAQRSR